MLVFLLIIAFGIFHVILMFPFATIIAYHYSYALLGCEVEDVITHLNNNNAPGIEIIASELIK